MNTQKLTSEDSVIGFGKHNGNTVRGVLQDDPQYLLWLVENTKRTDFPQSLIARIVYEAMAVEEEHEMNWGDFNT